MRSAVILAGGSGRRMGSDTPKQFLLLAKKPLIWYAVRAFSDSLVDEIVLVTREEDREFCRKEICEKYGFGKVKAVVPGGSERFYSVENGLKAVNPACDTVVIHDGARPLVTPDMISRVIADAERYGAATAAMPVKDTIKIVDHEGFGRETPDRRTLYQIQTPQAFSLPVLMQAFRKRQETGETDITDDTMMVERYMGVSAKMTEGSYRNIKVTTPEDLLAAELFLSMKPQSDEV